MTLTLATKPKVANQSSMRSKKTRHDSKPLGQKGYEPANVVSTITPIARPAIQAKLKVGEPNDKYEQEADRVADMVMRMPDPAAGGHVKPVYSNPGNQIQRMCSDCEEELQRKPITESSNFLQTKETPGGVPTVTPKVESQINGLKGRGQPLPQSVRNFFEPRFGYDFSDVRIHTDSEAAKSADALQSQAYTNKNDIVFDKGQYQVNNLGSQRLLAHELTHVVQQSHSSTLYIQRQSGTNESTTLTEGPEETTGPVSCGNFNFNGGNWNEDYRSLVCDAFNALPQNAQVLVDGLNIEHSQGVSMRGGEPGHYDIESDKVQLYCNVFNSCRSGVQRQRMSSDQRRQFAIRLLHHEFAHAMDLRPLRDVVREENAARHAYNREVDRQRSGDLDFDSVPGIEDDTPSTETDDQHRLQELQESLNEATAARRRRRSASGMAMLTEREQANIENPGQENVQLDDTNLYLRSPADRRQRRSPLPQQSEPNARIRTTRPTNEFQHAAELDGVRRITPPYALTNTYGEPIELSGGPVTPTDSVADTAYSNTNWMELYAVSFVLYLNGSTDLQNSHPRIVGYFRREFSRSP